MKYSIRWLTEKFDTGGALKYIFFWGHSSKHGEEVGKFVFSQWYPSSFVVDGVEYKTAEHWMMAQKAFLFDDVEIAGRILRADKPGEVKELGRQIRGFDEVVWSEWRYDIVRTGNIHKFNQDSRLRDYLVGTADRILVEASPVDQIWGIGLNQDFSMIDNPYTWNGLNLLGFALMEVRDFLIEFGTFNYITAEVLPPWKAYPAVDPLDMFWRMGNGQEYHDKFISYLHSLSHRDQKIFELSYPATGNWRDFYH
jgi:ribA/ribD-fused uncharacterized protein